MATASTCGPAAASPGTPTRTRRWPRPRPRPRRSAPRLTRPWTGVAWTEELSDAGARGEGRRRIRGPWTRASGASADLTAEQSRQQDLADVERGGGGVGRGAGRVGDLAQDRGVGLHPQADRDDLHRLLGVAAGGVELGHQV